MVYTENCNCHKQGARLRHSGKINRVDNDKKSRNENALISTFKLIFRRHFLPAWTLSCNSDTITTSAPTQTPWMPRTLSWKWTCEKIVFFTLFSGHFYFVMVQLLLGNHLLFSTQSRRWALHSSQTPSPDAEISFQYNSEGGRLVPAPLS